MYLNIFRAHYYRRDTRCEENIYFMFAVERPANIKGNPSEKYSWRIGNKTR